MTPLDMLRSGNTYRATYRAGDRRASITLLEKVPDAETTSILVKARRFVTISRNAVAPSYLQSRVGLPLPRVAAVEEIGEESGGEEGREFRSLMAFVLGMQTRLQKISMPRDVFRGVFMDLLMPSWDPLRSKRT